MKIDVWVDYICPFCYIGKRNLALALDDFEGSQDVIVEVKSFLLNPELSTEPHLTVDQYVSERYGQTLEQAKAGNARIAEMAKRVGLPIDFDKTFMVNSFDAHRVLQYAKTANLGSALFDGIQQAYYANGAIISDHETLAALGESVGLVRDDILDILASDKLSEEVYADYNDAKAMEISGVPFFVIDGKYGLSGAQPPDVISDTLRKAAE